MFAQQLLNEKYKELCSKYGDLIYRRDAINKQINELEELIRSIDISLPEVKLIEQLTRASLEKQKADEA